MTDYTPDTPLDAIALPWEEDAVPPTIAADIKRHAVKLAALRVELAAREAGIKAKRAAFEATLTTQLQNVEALRREVEATEGTVRALALVEHETSGTTKPCPGVSVVIGKEYEIDEAAGLAWAKEKGLCLVPESLNVKEVKALASNVVLPFVTVREKPSVRLATDLLKALGEAA